MHTTLRELKPGESGVVLSVGMMGAVRRRLLDMGLIPGTRIFVRKIAPFGDPIEINLRNYELSLRKAEAEQIIVERSGCSIGGRRHGQCHHHRFGWKPQ